MKHLTILPVLFFLLSIQLTAQNDSWIRVNQLGYINHSVKNAVFVSKSAVVPEKYEIINEEGDVVHESREIKSFGKYGAFNSTFRLNFTGFERDGVYKIRAAGAESPYFRISSDVYSGTADFVLQYLRQQRCGYNPFLKDSCHTHDGFIADHPARTGEHIDVTGGWHDATDYLQYLTTSATTAYQMMFAYQMNPNAFGDEYDASGNPGANGIPDILDEAKWGLDWLNKMNPEKNVMFNQIADDRDHAGFRLPNKDSVSYGQGLERPVYFVTGKPQGLCKYKNRTTGVSSTAAKYASAFALGAELMENYYPEFSSTIKQKAYDAYEYAKSDLGVFQTASCKSPYFYEEDNYVDDMELAASQLFKLSGDGSYLKEAAAWGRIEPVTPWMGADTMRHYQWYPFINLGHINILQSAPDDQIMKYVWMGLNKIHERGKDNPFNIGIPFIWCSNNLVSAAVTQAHLYRRITGDDKFKEMEAALRDWLFGCNPWGTSMIVGLPAGGDYPDDPHSSLWIKEGWLTTGGLVDGPIYASIFNYLEYLKIVNGDEYSEFQSDEHVYHDDYGDYSTNEPTMDGTAGLTYILSALEEEGKYRE